MLFQADNDIFNDSYLLPKDAQYTKISAQL